MSLSDGTLEGIVVGVSGFYPYLACGKCLKKSDTDKCSRCEGISFIPAYKVKLISTIRLNITISTLTRISVCRDEF